MKIIAADDVKVILIPESIEETGVMQWLGARYSKKPVRLLFDTHHHEKNLYYPAMWIFDDSNQAKQ